MNQLDTIKQMKSDLQADIASLVRDFETKSGVRITRTGVVVKAWDRDKIGRDYDVNIYIQNPFENE